VTAGERRLRALIADDHWPTRDDLRRVLADSGAFDICAVVANAAQAVQAAVVNRPDVCLLDIRMPGSGIAAAWEISARLPEAKIVMLTVSDDDTDLFAALRAGADGYLLKTMNFSRLPDALAGVCSGEAAMQRTLVARVLERFRGQEPRWRQILGSEPAGGRLTSREWEVLELLTRERSTAEIAQRLVISPGAVRVHVCSIVRKLRATDRAGVIELFKQPGT
jgi:DNA-binding NarL/FixJ family response regulator